ncbi:MAG: M48 family metallopeptidase [Verrucomicrobiota bacterium]|jgi:STE24 endopeptidase
MHASTILTFLTRASAGAARHCRRSARGARLMQLLLAGWLALLAMVALPVPTRAADAPAPSGTALDVEAATRAYLDRLSPEKRARSDAYFEGGYWLQLWGFLYGAAVALLLLQTRFSAWMRDRAVRLTRFLPLQTAAYGVQFIVVSALLSLPLAVYTDHFREVQYGLGTQNLAGWFGDWMKSLLVNVVLGGVLMMALFGVVRRLPRSWHVWGAMVMVAFQILTSVIGPVFIAPLFNQYTPLRDPKVVDPILRLARANGITADKVFEMDASRQTTRVSANVSGFLGTTRITLNDNLLKRCASAEVEAVMAHEIGHYVLNHVFKATMFFGILIVAGFAVLRWVTDGLLRRFGGRWGLRGIGDPAVTPLVMLLFATGSFLATPFTNSFIRSQETEADIFGLNAARQPDAFAEVSLKLAEYRKLEPGPAEEWIFYDHPSGAARIRMAMRWKKEHPGLPSAP